MKEIIADILAHENAMPCLFYPVSKELGFSIEEILTDSDKQVMLLEHIANNYPVSAVVRMTELWCEATAFGMDISFSDTDFPKLGDALVEFPEDYESIVIPNVVNPTTAPLIQAVKKCANTLSKPLIVGVTGPYTLGSVLSGSENFMVNCMMEPQLCHDLLERITNFLIDYILEYKNAGAKGIMIAEPSTAMVSPDMMEEFSNQYLQRIISKVSDDNFAVIYHNCGSVTPHLATIATINADAFHFGSDVDLTKALNIIPKDKLVMGNIEPQLFLSANTDKLNAAKQDIINLRFVNPNLVLSTGCDLSPSADLNEIKRIFN